MFDYFNTGTQSFALVSVHACNMYTHDCIMFTIHLFVSVCSSTGVAGCTRIACRKLFVAYAA